MVPTKKRELLLYGFTRLNYKSNFESVPDDIISLFNKWISNAWYMILEGDKLNEFLSIKADNCMKETLTINITDEISFECSLFPDGQSYRDETCWCVRFITSNPNIKHPYAFIECGCEEIPNSIYKEPAKSFARGHDNANFLEMIPRSKCQNINKLSFYIDIELISYEDDTEIKYLSPSPIYNSIIEYKWIIDNTKCVKGDWIFSSNFMNQSIGMYCTPKGSKSDGPNSIITFGIEFYKTPHAIQWLKCNIKLTTNIEKEDGEFVKFVPDEDDYEYVGDGSGINLYGDKYDDDFQVGLFSKCDRIEMILSIEITEIESKNGKIVDRTEWDKYGVIDLKQRQAR